MEKVNKYNLTDGGILNKLFLVALPIIGTQVIQMAYNLTDMFWLGRLSSDAVAASGTVGLYMWLSMSFQMFGRMGAEIGVAQNIGRGDRDKALSFSQNSILIGVLLGTALAAVYITCRRPLVGFFRIQEAHVAQDARDYLAIVGIAIPFTFLTGAVTGTFNGSGNSRVSLLVNGAGLVLNMTLDPLLIFVAGMGIKGAAVATAIAQAVAACLSLAALFKAKNRPFPVMRLTVRFKKAVIKQIVKWVAPISTEGFLFTFLTMLTATFVASYGANAMAASRVGSQIESLTWLIGGGFSSALTAFVGQNFGAAKYDRIKRGFRISSAMMLFWGAAVSFLLYFGGRALYGVFIPDNSDVVGIGAGYMRILALCQVASCLEGVATGSFRGQGRTIPSSITSGTSNALRVVLAFFLSRYTSLGLTGIWIALAAGASLRGAWVYIWYVFSKKPVQNTPAIT
ncbi:MAG: MATE family efflux transporter [Oscillospiraceae bacterium]|nr:MATE family efflux transporter [Oscillospiraceae bacterium]